MKLLFSIIIILFSLSLKADNTDITSITITVNNNIYKIMLNPERPYIVWVNEDTFIEDNSLDGILSQLLKL